MLDSALRPLKDRLLEPLAGLPIPPLWLTLLGLALGLVAAVLAAQSRFPEALACFWAGRLCDGLDGVVARRQNRQSDRGGYLDLMADILVYASIVLALGCSRGDRATLLALAFLLASYYVNAASWMLLSALLKRPEGSATSLVMPAGMVGGTETIILYTLLLVFPAWMSGWFWLTAALVSLGAAQRVAWSVRHLPG
ncbi:MAG: hypothetical protein AMXMBFR33_41650 [Candidatus Xenobia bacterium]